MARRLPYVATVLLGIACSIHPLDLLAQAPGSPSPGKSSGWPVYGGQGADDHYSDLSQINRTNVRTLKVAWKYDTGETGGMETSPIVVGRSLYAYTPSQKVIALDAASGKLLWTFDPGTTGHQPTRGVAYWTDGKYSRVFAGAMNYLYALDAATGKPDPSFGENGRIDLRKGLRGDYKLQSVVLTTPGIVYKDLIVVGGRNPETPPAPPGDIRAFDVHTGALRWRFRTIPRPGELGYNTWPKNAWKTAGAANNWAGMALDRQKGIVYVPTGSAVPDFYGADRVGDDLFADSLLALDAETGKLLWYFQGVHHDIWDRDFPSPPSLVTVKRNGKYIPAVAQTTKQGFVYLFNRYTGTPLFPIEERRYPPSHVPGEVSAAEQPSPLVPKPFARQILTQDMLTNRTPQAHAWAVRQFRTFRSAGQFVPLSVGKPTVVFPGFDGGAEWGGSAVDPGKAIIYINSNDVAWTGALARNTSSTGPGRKIYEDQCAVCHGDDRAGSPPAFPSLLHVGQRMTSSQISSVIHAGRGRMPSFPSLQGDGLAALLAYLRTGKDSAAPGPAQDPHRGREVSAGSFNKEMQPPQGPPDTQMKYRFTGYRKFLDPDGYPAVAPPWGTLNAIDLNTGKYVWKVPLGEYPELAAKGMGNTGSENYGGPVLTAGGLLFIGATIYDKELRAFDSETGKVLWEATLPFAGVATPATYMVDGKQYVVIAAGGGRDSRSPSGGVYIAFALP